MTRRNRPDERATDALFSGQVPAGREDLADVAAFASALRAQATAAPAPNAELAELLAEGLVPDHQPAPRAASSPIRRRRKMLEALLAKVAALGLTAKAGIAGAAVVASVGGAGAADVLPGPLQDGFDQVTSAVSGDDLPEEADVRDANAENHGEDAATNGDGQNPTENVGELTPEDGCEYGHAVAEAAGGDPDEAECPEDEVEGERPADPGQEGRDTAGTNAGTNGEDGRATADDAATRGEEFGQEQGTEGQQTGSDASEAGDTNSDGAATSGDEQSDGAATSGQEQSDGAADSGEEQSGDAGDDESGGASNSGDEYRDGDDG